MLGIFLIGGTNEIFHLQSNGTITLFSTHNIIKRTREIFKSEIDNMSIYVKERVVNHIGKYPWQGICF
jgi:hypothetical protein